MSDENKIDWKRLMLRKDRPLPKAGCSWAFYIVLLLLIVYLVVMFVKYKQL
ncbi:MAG: hypothetical protein IKN84_07340 [Bacteroidales bacterium]|jgi:hypothetical protein|nr:hypothetical protein [Bacteroidales bacterium]